MASKNLKKLQDLDGLFVRYSRYWGLRVEDLDFVFKLHKVGFRDKDCRFFLREYLEKDISRHAWHRFKRNLRRIFW